MCGPLFLSPIIASARFIEDATRQLMINMWFKVIYSFNEVQTEDC
jgi:hypothetical protein